MLESLAGLLLFAWGACRFIALCMGCLKYEHMVAILGITVTRAPKKPSTLLVYSHRARFCGRPPAPVAF